ncbi:phosphotransferase [Armatimonas sp.]|uniref:phosphotransferase n=1 Tax=Armatimonas sp. TaxID=1872638 RepID=UPI00286A0E32|nr:phosphotransferase [Armatimonas sp.]
MFSAPIISLGLLAFQGERSTVSRVVTQGGRQVIQKLGATSREGEIVSALAAYQPLAPAFLGEDASGALYFSELPGINLAEAFEQTPERRTALAEAFGRALRNIHAWEPPIPKPETLWRDDALSRIQATAEKRFWESIELSYTPFAGERYTEVADWVERESPTVPSQLAFCHGDACLPNFMIEAGTITGIVDWGEGGWADPRYDLATALWSLRRNSNGDPKTPRYQDAFLRGYGWEGGVESLRLFEAFYTLWN